MFGKIKLYFAMKRAQGDIEKAGGMDKLKSRKFWASVIVGVAGVVANALGVTPEHWQPIADWLIKILAIYTVGNIGEHVASAVITKKNGNGVS